jgi:phage shock protein PspC (stress-responsive transcriptional regulator)
MHIETDKRYYSIGEIAKAFDVNASLIRFGTVNLTFLAKEN